jgi:hypothetical protein
MADIRDELIRHAVCDVLTEQKTCSFLEVGGLWPDGRGEKVTAALKAGATRLIEQDSLKDDAVWTALKDKVSALGSEVACIPLSTNRSRPPPCDVAFSSGVLYHSSDPLRLLDALTRPAMRWCILCSCVTDSDDDNWTLAPASSQRAALSKRFGPEAIGLSVEPARWDLTDSAPYWWLPSKKALNLALEWIGFNIVRTEPFWDGRVHCVLARRKLGWRF